MELFSMILICYFLLFHVGFILTKNEVLFKKLLNLQNISIYSTNLTHFNNFLVYRIQNLRRRNQSSFFSHFSH